jgi:hypothetical protein
MSKKNSRDYKIETEIIEIFGAETVPLDDELISQLVQRGWDRVQLERAKLIGFEYCLKRDSLFDGPEFHFWPDKEDL